MKNIFAFTLVILLFNGLSAQEYYKSSEVENNVEIKNKSNRDLTSYFEFSYNYSTPFSNDENPFISSVSDYGFNVGFHYMFNDKISLGANIAFNSFSEYESDVKIDYSNGFVYANQYRFLSAFNFMPKARYYPFSNKYIKPYVGFGAGLSYLVYRNEMGYYAGKDTFTEFAIQPELGTLVRVTENIYINLNINYNQVWPSSNQPDFRTASASFGLIFK